MKVAAAAMVLIEVIGLMGVMGGDVGVGDVGVGDDVDVNLSTFSDLGDIYIFE